MCQARCVDELESRLSKHGSLKKLYFYHQHLTIVFRNTMFGPEGRLQHCCAWLGVDSSFPECASTIVPEEIKKALEAVSSHCKLEDLIATMMMLQEISFRLMCRVLKDIDLM